MRHKVLLIPGDGIGPEVVEAVKHILGAVTSGSGGGNRHGMIWFVRVQEPIS